MIKRGVSYCIYSQYIMDSFPQVDFKLGEIADQIVSFLDRTFVGLFDVIYFLASRTINGIDSFLTALPWYVFILIIFALGWYFRTFFSGILYAIYIFLIGTFGLWDDMMMTIAIIITAVVISLLIGIPFGIWMSFSRIFSTFMRPILDAMQTMPSFVYLIPAIFFFGLGNVSAIFATLIYALSPVFRLTELAISGVDQEVIETDQTFGSSRWQILRKVQLP